MDGRRAPLVIMQYLADPYKDKYDEELINDSFK